METSIQLNVSVVEDDQFFLDLKHGITKKLIKNLIYSDTLVHVHDYRFFDLNLPGTLSYLEHEALVGSPFLLVQEKHFSSYPFDS